MYYKVYDCESEELYEGRFKEKKKKEKKIVVLIQDEKKKIKCTYR